MKKSVKQIITSKVIATIEASSLTPKQKAELIADIHASLATRTTVQKEKGDTVFDAYLNDYINKSHMTTKKVKLKDGTIKEAYVSMSKESRSLKLEMKKIEEANQAKIVDLVISGDKDAKKKVVKITRDFEKLVADRKAKLLKQLK